MPTALIVDVLCSFYPSILRSLLQHIDTSTSALVSPSRVHTALSGGLALRDTALPHTAWSPGLSFQILEEASMTLQLSFSASL